MERGVKNICFGSGQDFELFAVHCCHHCNLLKTAKHEAKCEIENPFSKIYFVSNLS